MVAEANERILIDLHTYEERFGWLQRAHRFCDPTPFFNIALEGPCLRISNEALQRFSMKEKCNYSGRNGNESQQLYCCQWPMLTFLGEVPL